MDKLSGDLRNITATYDNQEYNFQIPKSVRYVRPVFGENALWIMDSETGQQYRGEKI